MPTSKCSRDPPCDGYVGGLNLMSGCYSFYEAWTLAEEEIARAGRYPEAIARLDAGATVRSLLAEWFGVSSESAPGDTAFYETRAFRRTLRYARARHPRTGAKTKRTVLAIIEGR